MNKLKPFLRVSFPHFIAISVFLIISFIYFFPAIQGKVLHGGDNISAKGSAGEVSPYTMLTGDYCAWTNSAFGGMPAYTIWVKSNSPLNYITRIINFFTTGGPISYLFIAMISFYLLLICYGVNPWLSIIGSIAYALSTHFIVIIGAGHITKALGLAYMPGVLAGIFMVYKNNKPWLGSVIMALFLAMEIGPGHYQIIYYTILIIVTIGIYYLINAFKNKILPAFIKNTAILFVAALLAALTNISAIWTIQEYTPLSARGESILTLPQNTEQTASKDGLSFEYATDWSYGIAETFNLLIPNFRGGSVTGSLSENSEVFKLYSRVNRAQANQAIKQLPLYWGPQPFTEGPAYLGAILVFLFVFALFFLKNKEKWWILILSVFAIMLAWGDNFELFNRFIFNYLPLYNKFRAVTTTLFILQFTIPFLGIIALNQMFKDYDKSHFIPAFIWSFSMVGGICLLFVLFPGLAGNFTGHIDANYANNPEFVNAMMIDRKSILRSDAIRSFFFITAGAGVLWLYHIKKLNKILLGVSMLVIILLDLALVDKRYVSFEAFRTDRAAKDSFEPTKADFSIFNMEIINPEIKDKVDIFLETYKNNAIIKNHESPNLVALNLSTNYRVLNLSDGIDLSDPMTSYYHKSLSGYSPAKLRRYQDIIDRGVLVNQIQNLARNVQSGQNTNSFSLINMLNTKYIITNPDHPAFLNKYALGNAWFVKKLRWVETANQEFESINNLDPREEAIVHVEFKGEKTQSIGYDSTGTIYLTNYRPHILTYKSNTKANMLAVFSEVYYPKGWNVYIDDKKVDYLRANYLFRALIVPEGDHKIEFRFEPRSYLQGNRINAMASYLLLVSLLITFLFYLRNYILELKKPDEN